MHSSGGIAAKLAALGFITIAIAAAGGCGQTGALYLPEDDRPQDAETPAGDDEQDEDEQQ